MITQSPEFARFIELLGIYAPNEGTSLYEEHYFGAVRSSHAEERYPTVDKAFILVVGQGKKFCYLEEDRFEFEPGRFHILFFPMPVEVQVVEASPQAPFLAAGFGVDLTRISEILREIEDLENVAQQSPLTRPLALASGQLTSELLNPIIRFMEALAHPKDIAVLGKRILDEIYYRILCSEAGIALRELLRQHGNVQQLSRAVAHIHQHLDKLVSVEELAALAGMSRTIFFQEFKSLTQMTPLQYAKSIKLHAAQRFLKEGKNVNEAAFSVGYNSATQFSREYKRLFGIAPSRTAKP